MSTISQQTDQDEGQWPSASRPYGTTEETDSMTTRILANVAAIIIELKANSMKVATSTYGEPVTVCIKPK